MGSRGIIGSFSDRRRRGITLSWLVIFVLSILMQYGLLANPSSALAATGLQAGTVQGFEIDGDVASGNGASNPGSIPAALIDSLSNGDDWRAGSSGTGVVNPVIPGSSTIVHDIISSTSDDGFGGGSKETDTRTWSYDLHKATPKDDVEYAMAYAKFVGASAFFYAGATRIVNTGDTHIDFELNRNPFKVYSDGISKPDRTVGDILVSLEFSNGGSDPIVTVYKVTAVANYPTGQDTTYGTDIATAASIHSATNFGALADQGFGAIPAFEFAELSIDLSALGINTGCPGLSNGHIRTRSGGDIDSSQLKDNIQPFPIDLNNCGKIRIEKHAGTDNGPLLGGATFTVTDDPRPGQPAGTYTITDNGAGDANATAGVIEIDPAKPGTYTICETVPPAGYKLANPACQQSTVNPNGSVTVKFADPRKSATTTLVTVGANPTNGSYVVVGQSISLTVTETNTGESILHNVVVSGTNSCASWTAATNKNNSAGAFGGTLNPGESVNFTCSFSVPNVSDFAWSATATGLDELNAQHDPTAETVSGGYDVLQPATVLSIVQNAPAQVHAGDSVTIIVNEKNTGEGTITGVHVDGTGACAGNWVPSAGFSGTLAPNASVNFTCSFTAPAGDFSWTADGKGTDLLSHAVPATNEHQAGSVAVVIPSTLLTLVSAPTIVHAGDTITVIVRETNTGNGPLSNVHVVAGGDCASFTPANVATLAAAAHQDFTCTITTTTGNGTDKSWTADGKGTDSIGAAAPDTGEHQEGAVTVIAPATTLVLVSAPTKVLHDTQVTITVRESNVGDDMLTGVNVTGTNSCATWVAASQKNNGAGAFTGSLAPGQSVNFSCNFSAGTTDVSWTALGHGTDSLQVAAPDTNEDEAGVIDVINPATTLTLVSETPDPVLAHGSTTITVRETNVGDSTLTGVSVTGAPCATWAPVGAGFSGTLVAGAFADFSCTVADVGTSNVVWNALGHGTDELRNPAPLDNEDEAGSVHVVNTGIDVVKTAGATLGNQAADGTVYETQDGTSVVYKYVVTTQDADGITSVQVSDDLCSPVTAVTASGHNVGDTNGNDKLEPGESWVFSCSKLLTVAADGAAVHNVATASGQPIVGGRVSDTDDADVALLTPGITVVKTAGDAPDGETFVTESFANNVAYHYSITNSGELTLSNVTVVDDNGTPANTADDFVVCTIPTLGVGATVACQVTLTIVHDTTNVVVATGHTAQKPADDVSASDDAVVDVVGAAIQIVKTAGDAADGAEYVTEPGTNNVTYHYLVTNTGDVDLLDVHVIDDAGTPGDTSDDIAVCTIASLPAGFSAPCSITLSISVTTTNIAVASGHTEQQPDTAVAASDDAVVRVPGLTIDKSFTGNTAGTASGGTALALVGDTLTYALDYVLTDGPVTNGVITDTLPAGLGYITGSATNSAEFTFVGYDAGTRTLSWTAANVTTGGSVTYRVTVLAGSLDLPQPLVNTATIDSDQTAPDSGTAEVGIQSVLSETSPPTSRPTLPPTDTIDNDAGSSTPGFGLMLVLLVLTGIGLVAGQRASTPRRLRREEIRRR